MRIRDLVAAALLGGALLSPAPLRAQSYLTRPQLDWRTVDTRYYTVYYPKAMETWSLDMARHLDAVHDAVSALVGNAPRAKITIVVEDPLGVPNGFALPFLHAPAIFMWPEPPDPQSAIGNHPGWSEILSVHEYTHIAHLTRPSRNPWRRFIWRILLPADIGPIALDAPRWVDEGYATYVEGKLTGSGRPHGVYRATILREWAREGKMPNYEAMSASDGYLGGGMAYLAGSSFLEWLGERRGDSSFVLLWRRMTARRVRGFDEAFIGVYGDTPQDLYDRFVAELTGKAMDVERRVDSLPDAQGELVQHLAQTTGEPAVSPDGKHIAVVLRSTLHPSRVVIWNTAAEPPDTADARARRELLRRDSLDVPAIQVYPRAKKPIASLPAWNGFGYDAPRFLPDGKQLLLARYTSSSDGTYRPDLFIWNARTGRVRQVTHHAGIRSADPMPDGRNAVGVACDNGLCNLVRVDLASGAMTVLAHGTPDVIFYRPRVSHDGNTIAFAVQEHGTWRIALMNAAGGDYRFVGPSDGASRYAASFLPDGRSLVEVSELGGVMNIERMDIATGAVEPLTRMVGAAIAPEPNPRDSSIYFLSLWARGLDLRRIALDSAARGPMVVVDSSVFPAGPLAAKTPPDTFPVNTLTTPRPYGLGARQWNWLVGGGFNADGGDTHALVSNSDIVGRLNVLAQGWLGDHGHWTGGSLAAGFRRTRPGIRAEIFSARQEPSDSRVPLVPSTFDLTYTGGDVSLELLRNFGWRTHRYVAGGSFGRFDDAALGNPTRSLGYAGYTASYRWLGDGVLLGNTLALHGAGGRTSDSTWTRGVASLGVLLQQTGGLGVRGDATYGAVSSNAPALEQFLVGGPGVPFAEPELMTQRIAMPEVPLGIAGGRKVLWWRGTLTGAFPFDPYLESVSAGDRLTRSYRVVGIEQGFSTDPVSVVRLPGFTAVGGASYTIDRPFRHRYRAYLTVQYRP